MQEACVLLSMLKFTLVVIQWIIILDVNIYYIFYGGINSYGSKVIL